ncbi:hypothetical protein SmJEL517_g00196 [Synchytrium microbalum]|uniref:BRCT domain-containing protein n=1 Tax=Synchytrium microbalum TaxID=1806994 RepID=A0A507CG83_9FUNG|nr:uncharacterized protein SmJEL517_g00196 [Synchytrium microbalum]TPX38378.1 hypothetical protein SmJEL517_g00196 [Synchytrium microbalum]
MFVRSCRPLQKFSTSFLPLSRFISTPRGHAQHVGVVFDIDGVLLRGKDKLESAKEAMSLIKKHEIPFVLLTNGGSMLESQKAEQVSKVLGVEISGDQVILSHTPFRALASRYQNDLVLWVGPDSVKDVAQNYGFNRVVVPEDILRWNNATWPFKEVHQEVNSSIDFAKESFAAVFVAHDSYDWGRDSQLIIDILRSKDGVIGTLQSRSDFIQEIPIFFSNPDFIFSGKWNIPRFAQGAFAITLKVLYKELTKTDLVHTTYGKPNPTAYEYCTKVMETLGKKPMTYYAIGDNPASDIAGANMMGWHSILVKTGVWNAEQHGHDHNATTVVHDVLEAVHFIIKTENLITSHPGNHAHHVGVVFDIDGVLLHGKAKVESAKEALNLIKNLEIPFVLLTNGGGVTEEEKAKKVSKKLGFEISGDQVIMAHTPMKRLASRYQDDLVLWIGPDEIKDVAHHYGFNRVVLSDDIMRWNKSIYPFRQIQEVHGSIDFSKECIGAVFVAHDSQDWGRDIQLIVDILRSKHGVLGTWQSASDFTQQIPVYFANPDFVFSNKWGPDRLSQGAFAMTLKMIYKELTKTDLIHSSFGKPYLPAYEHAKMVMESLGKKPMVYYGIGDNPASDIAGANMMGWHSILVETGVWSSEEHGNNHNASAVVHDVLEAVNYIIKNENLYHLSSQENATCLEHREHHYRIGLDDLNISRAVTSLILVEIMSQKSIFNFFPKSDGTKMTESEPKSNKKKKNDEPLIVDSDDSDDGRKKKKRKSVGSSKSKKAVVSSDDDDDIEKPKSKKKKVAKVVVDDDSDFEEAKKPVAKEAAKGPKKRPADDEPPTAAPALVVKKPKVEPPPLKEVTTSSFFGKSEIKQVDTTLVKKAPPKPKPAPVADKPLDDFVDDDLDEATIEQMFKEAESKSQSQSTSVKDDIDDNDDFQEPSQPASKLAKSKLPSSPPPSQKAPSSPSKAGNSSKLPSSPSKSATVADSKPATKRPLPWLKPDPAALDKQVGASSSAEASPVRKVDSVKAESPLKKVASPKKEAAVKKDNVVNSEDSLKKEESVKKGKGKDEDNEDGDEEEKELKKKANFWAIQNRRAQGPAAPGSKPIPEGAENCLLVGISNLTFVFTGDLSSISRDDAKQLVERYGARVTSAVSGKTTYLVVGEEPGESKTKKATELKVKILDEDGLFELIATRPGKDGSAPEKKKSAATIKKEKEIIKSVNEAQKAASTPVASASGNVSRPPPPSGLWTDKYKPKSYSEVLGNKGIIEKLAKWLKDWHSSTKNAKEPKAALLSGPPGLGKTTAAHLVANMEGYEALEFNASDTRSKRKIHDLLAELTDGGKSMTDFFTVDGKGKGASKQANRQKQLIIMDEVDGMSGGDRGGSQELIKLIKTTNIPIVCICNDRQSTKVKSLANYCLDLKFRKISADGPTTMRLTAIATAEGLSINQNAFKSLLECTNGDIRQVLNVMETWRLSHKSMSYDETKTLAEKNYVLGPWQVMDKYFHGPAFRSMTVPEKIELYYNDFDLLPLFVQENYLRQEPALVNEMAGSSFDDRACATMDCMSLAAESIAFGDVISASIRSRQNWSLMPAHSVYSCVIPAFFTHGKAVQAAGSWSSYSFPSWLGKNSSQTKNARLLKELQIHMRPRVSADKKEIRQSYFGALVPRLTKPLLDNGSNGVDEVIDVMDEYYLNKEDWETILDLTIGGDKLLKSIDPSAKSAFTRIYNKRLHPTALISAEIPISKKRVKEAQPDFEDLVDAGDDEDGGDEADGGVTLGSDDSPEDEDATDLAADKMVKQKSGKGSAAGKGTGKGASKTTLSKGLGKAGSSKSKAGGSGASKGKKK